MNEYNQTRVDIGNDPLLIDCYTKVLLPILVAAPNVTIRQHATDLHTIHILMPFFGKTNAPVDIPVREMQLGSCFESMISTLKSRLRVLYHPEDKKALHDVLAGGYTEQEVKETKLDVVNTAAEQMLLEMPENKRDYFREALTLVTKSLTGDLKRIIYSCLVEAPCEIVVTNKVGKVTRS